MSVLKTKPQLHIKPFSDVYISIGNGKLNNVLKKGFDALGGIEKYIKTGQSVLLKPNLTAGADPATGGTTDARFCEAVVELIKKYCDSGTICIGENTGHGNVTMEAYQRFGYVDMCKRQGIELIDFTDTERIDVHIPDAMYGEIISMPKIIMDIDVFITLPVLKTHDPVSVTAAIKNSFGLVTADTRGSAHRDNAVEQYIIDISLARKPDFTIVDGRIGMEGIAGGSRFDHPRYANRIIMGADPVAVDVVCTHIMMQNPRVRYLQWADERGLGNCNLDYINIHGMTLEDAKTSFMSPTDEFYEETEGRMQMIDLGSCSCCRTIIQGTMHRFLSPGILTDNISIVYGSGEIESSEIYSKNCLLAGNCIKEKYYSMGVRIPGCPIVRDDLINALVNLNVICSKCEELAKRFVEKHTPDELAFLRILASNKTIFQGADNLSKVTDFLLAVGDCQSYYARFHIDRGVHELVQMGINDKINSDFFVVYVSGHNPTLEDLESALIELKKRRENWEKLFPFLNIANLKQKI